MIDTLIETLRARFRAQQQSASPTDDISPSTTIPHLLTLPIELVISVAQFCSTEEIKRLCETCRSLHDACMPELYRVIDLSSHNSNLSSDPVSFDYHRVPLDFISRKWTELDFRVYQKQKKYMRTLVTKPGLAEYAKELHWTSLDLEYADTQAWDDQNFQAKLEKEEGNSFRFVSRYEDAYGNYKHDRLNNEDGDCRCERELNGFTERSQAVWRTFQRFVNVSRVDLCWLREGREILLPEPTLFPAARFVRLSGCMTPGLAETILTLPSRQLETLELHNLGQYLTFDPPLPHFTNIPEFAKYWRAHRTDHTPTKNTHLMVCPLNPSLGCTSLTSLTITTVGLHEECSPNSYDDRRYASWARLLASVRDNLTYFAFKQGVSRNDIALGHGSRYRPLWQKHRPMDRLFKQHFLPTLLEAPWAHIRRMEIRGVGRKVDEEHWDEAPTEKERMAEPDVEYDVRPEIPSPSSPGRRLGYSVTLTRIAFPKADQKILLDLLPDGAELIAEEEPERDYEDIQRYTHSGQSMVGFDESHDCTCSLDFWDC